MIFHAKLENQWPHPIDFRENCGKSNAPTNWFSRKSLENQKPKPMDFQETDGKSIPLPIDFHPNFGKSLAHPTDFRAEWMWKINSPPHWFSWKVWSYLCFGWRPAGCLAGNQNLAELSFGRSVDFSPQEIPSSGFLATRNPEQKFLATRNPKQGISRHKKS